MSVGQICSRDVVVIGPDATIEEAVTRLRDRHVGDLVVIDANDDKQIPIGIVTDRDIVIEVIAQRVPLDAVNVKDVMSDGLITAAESDELWGVLQRMRTAGVRRVPVVNSDGSLVGILAADDILSVLAEGLSDLAKLVTRQRAKEEKLRP